MKSESLLHLFPFLYAFFSFEVIRFLIWKIFPSRSFYSFFLHHRQVRYRHVMNVTFFETFKLGSTCLLSVVLGRVSLLGIYIFLEPVSREKIIFFLTRAHGFHPDLFFFRVQISVEMDVSPILSYDFVVWFLPIILVTYFRLYHQLQFLLLHIFLLLV